MRASRRVRLTYDELDELAARAHPDNPKRHDLAALDSSVGRFGYVTPIVVNDTDGRILEGHGRIESLVALKACGAEPPPGIQVGPTGEWRVPTVHGIELSPDDARAFLIAANRTAELGGWDEARLAALLSELARSETGLDAVGFSEADLSALLESLAIDTPPGGSDPDDIPEEPAEDQLYVAPGQLWRLGEHRLLCGDATRSEDVNRVLGGRNAHMVVTDPPYNVNYGNHGGAAGGLRRRALTNDSLPVLAWEEFVRGWVRQLLDHVDGALYVFMSSKEWPTVSRLLEEAGGHWSDTIIWAKDRFVLGRADYQRQYEPIWYGWRQGKPHYFGGGRCQSDIWEIHRDNGRSYLHPTQKPVELVQRAIQNSARPGQTVLDAFLGSGTTVIASEKSGRRCLGLEIDPLFCEVALARWERFTSERARRAD